MFSRNLAYDLNLPKNTPQLKDILVIFNIVVSTCFQKKSVNVSICSKMKRGWHWGMPYLTSHWNLNRLVRNIFGRFTWLDAFKLSKMIHFHIYPNSFMPFPRCSLQNIIGQINCEIIQLLLEKDPPKQIALDNQLIKKLSIRTNKPIKRGCRILIYNDTYLSIMRAFHFIKTTKIWKTALLWYGASASNLWM